MVKNTGSLSDIRYFNMRVVYQNHEQEKISAEICDFGYLAADGRSLPVQLFPLHFKNKFYRFFDIGKCFFPRLSLADCSRDPGRTVQ